VCLGHETSMHYFSCLGGESASRPLVDFGVLNDNLINGLTSCVKCTSRFLVKVQSIH
jgi:hypothetical protein